MKILTSIALLAAAVSANAATVTFHPGVSTPTSNYTVIDQFDDLSQVTYTGNVKTITAAATPDGARPAFAEFGSFSYLSVLAGGSATINFAPNTGAFQFDWGSIDFHNKLTIESNLGTLEVIPGQSIFPNIADGNQVSPGTNGLFQAVGSQGEYFTSITLESRSNSFEIDNLATITAVPEPGTWAMLIAGFGLIGLAARRRNQTMFVTA